MGDNDSETYVNVTKAEYDFNDESFDDISTEAKDFIGCLLIKDTKWAYDLRHTWDRDFLKIYLFIYQRKRMLAADCLAHPWLRKQQDETVKINTKNLRRFVIRRRWQVRLVFF